jgi:tripartite-type tricarboxylate transporter receptor subunit TctC
MLNKEVNAALASSGIQAQLANLHGAPLIGSPRDFGKLIERETEKWRKLVKGGKFEFKSSEP